MKFNLLPLALDIIRKSGTLQEYRTTMVVAHKGRYSNKKSSEMKRVEYWRFTSIVSEPKIRVKTILRKLGDRDIHFWSVMPDIKLGGVNQYKNSTAQKWKMARTKNTTRRWWFWSACLQLGTFHWLNGAYAHKHIWILSIFQIKIKFIHNSGSTVQDAYL